MTGLLSAVPLALTAAGGFFAGGVLVALLRGENVGRMFQGDPGELAIQVAVAVLAVVATVNML